MTKSEWKPKIIEACKAAGTYEPFFDSVIDTLSDILGKRDKAEELYQASGANPVITHVNKAKQSNITKNPVLVVWDDLNKSALSYWRDLGLTPAGLRHITNSAPAKKKRSKLEAAMEKLANEG